MPGKAILKQGGSFSCFSISFLTFTKERGDLTHPSPCWFTSRHIKTSHLSRDPNVGKFPSFTHNCRLHVFPGLNIFLLRTYVLCVCVCVTVEQWVLSLMSPIPPPHTLLPKDMLLCSLRSKPKKKKCNMKRGNV